MRAALLLGLASGLVGWVLVDSAIDGWGAIGAALGAILGGCTGLAATAAEPQP